MKTWNAAATLECVRVLVWERVCPNAVSVEVSVSVKMYHAEQFVRPYVLYQVCVSECMWYLCLCVCVSVRVVPPEGHKEGRPRDVPLRSSVVTPEDGGQIDELCLCPQRTSCPSLPSRVEFFGFIHALRIPGRHTFLTLT